MVSSRGASTSSLGASTSESDSGSQKRRSVTYATFQKWCRDFDRELQTLSWLDCNTIYKDGGEIVTHLKGSICTKLEAKIKGRRL